jgi:low temperature requirement protein LtrA
MGLFTLIVLGELIVGTAHAFTSVPATPWNVTAAVLAFVLAIGLFADYFSYIQRAGPACRLGAGQPFFYAHWPLLFGLIALSAGLEHAIRESAGAVSGPTAALAGGGMALWLLAELLLHRLEATGGSSRRHGIVYLTAVALVGVLMLAGPAMPALAFVAGLVAVSAGVLVADA